MRSKRAWPLSRHAFDVPAEVARRVKAAQISDCFKGKVGGAQEGKGMLHPQGIDAGKRRLPAPPREVLAQHGRRDPYLLSHIGDA